MHEGALEFSKTNFKLYQRSLWLKLTSLRTPRNRLEECFEEIGHQIFHTSRCRRTRFQILKHFHANDFNIKPCACLCEQTVSKINYVNTKYGTNSSDEHVYNRRC